MRVAPSCWIGLSSRLGSSWVMSLICPLAHQPAPVATLSHRTSTYIHTHPHTSTHLHTPPHTSTNNVSRLAASGVCRLPCSGQAFHRWLLPAARGSARVAFVEGELTPLPMFFPRRFPLFSTPLPMCFARRFPCALHAASHVLYTPLYAPLSMCFPRRFPCALHAAFHVLSTPLSTALSMCLVGFAGAVVRLPS